MKKIKRNDTSKFDIAASFYIKPLRNLKYSAHSLQEIKTEKFHFFFPINNLNFRNLEHRSSFI